MKIVCNTSPLILLAKIHRLDTLIRLYSELMIPKAVADEIGTKPGKENDQVQALLKKGALQLRQVSAKILAELPIDLGLGEREAIALAIDSGADLVILDDQQGRLLFLVIKVCRSPGRLVYLLRRKKEVLFPLCVLKWIA